MEFNMKPIPKYERYLATIDGRVWSTISKKFLKLALDKDGYQVCKPSPSPTYKKVHRLVAEAWLPNPQCKPHVNHEDGDKTNNSVINLSWCTQSENELHAYATGLKNTGHLTKLSPADVKEIQSSEEMGTVLAERYGVTPTRISQVRNGKA